MHCGLSQLERVPERAEDRAGEALCAVSGFVYVCSLCIPRPLRVSELTFIAAVFMAVDMLGRLNEAVGQRQVVRGKKAQ